MTEKPDFSGEWILNRRASTLSPGADAVQSGVWRIEHREAMFRHKATFVTESNPIEYEDTLRSDGPDIADSQPGGSLRWNGSALVIRFREMRGSDSAIEIVFRARTAGCGTMPSSE